MQRLLKTVMIWLKHWVNRMVDYAKVYFLTQNPIDKILFESETTSDTYSGGDPTNPVRHNFAISHDIGTSVIVNGMFSVDGSNFYPCGLSISQGPSSLVNADQFVDCDMYADASNVNVYITNGCDANRTVHIYYVLEALE